MHLVHQSSTLRALAFISLMFSGAGALRAADFQPEELRIGLGYTGALDQHQTTLADVELRFSPVIGETVRPWALAAATNENAFYVGAGLVYTLESDKCDWSASIGFGPGYYQKGDDIDLGGNFQIFTFGEVAYRLFNDSKLALRLAHLSNAGLRADNPGTEILTLSYSIPLAAR